MSAIQGTGSNHVYQPYNNGVNSNNNSNGTNKAENNLEDFGADILDIVDVSKSSSGTYKSNKIYTRDDATINYLNSVADSNMKKVQDLVQKLLAKQADAYKNTIDSIEIDDETRAAAADLISEDGPLGVKAVSGNILDFAKALSGGDPSKIEVLREATQKGFDEVAEMFGGWDKLPEITKQTYEAVMKGFDDWAAESES